jgi:Patatin-like phospholipase
MIPAARSEGRIRGAALIVALAAISVLLAACGGLPRRPAPTYWYNTAVPAGFPGTVRAADRPEDIATRAPQLIQRVNEAAHGGPVNVLALSGGGAGSAFGAGALVGWSHRGTRPDFEIVTGVSAGALIAPFAFLGQAWDAQLGEAFSGARTAHLLQRRWVGSWLRSSLYRGEPLVELVDYYVTEELLAAIANKAAAGGILLVATTDLDKQRTVIWNLGVVASIGGERGRRLFRDVIVASASIPGVFPPVLIRVEESGEQFDELHVDGGTTTPLFIAPEIVNVLPDRLTELRGANVYVIVNGQLGVPTETVDSGTLAVVKRSVSAVLQSNSRLAIEVTSALAQQNGMQFFLTAIPNGFPYHGPLDMTPANMKALFDFGTTCAADDQLWGSPIEVLQAADEDPARVSGVTARCPAPPAALVASVTRRGSAAP